MTLTEQFEKLLQRVDLALLAGRRTVVAVDPRPGLLRLLVLENRTNPFRRYLPRFEVVRTLEKEVPPAGGAGDGHWTSSLAATLREEKLAASLVAITLPEHLTRTLLVTLPTECESIESWIEEHFESLEFGLRRDEVTIRSELLSQDEEGIKLELAGVRTRALEEIEDRCLNEGLEVVWIGTAERALKSALDLTSTQGKNHPRVRLGLLSKNMLTVDSYESGVKWDRELHGVDDQSEIGSILSRLLSDARGEGVKGSTVLLASRDPVEKVDLPQEVEYFSPLGVEPHLAHLVGVAAGSFYPELAGVNFLREAERDRRQTSIAKKVFERVALASGGCIILLLTMLAIGTMVLEGRLEAGEEAARRSGVSLEEVRHLESESMELRKRLHERTTQGRSTARLLYELARLNPDSVFFSALTLNSSPGGGHEVRVQGYARGATHLASFLSSLESSDRFRSVKLIRSASAATINRIVMPVSLRKVPAVTFQVVIIGVGERD